MALTKVDLANTVEGILPVANGGTGTSTGVSPGGSTTQVQYNNAGAFGGSANFVWDNTNARLGIATPSPSYRLDITNSGYGWQHSSSTGTNSIRTYAGSDYQIFETVSVTGTNQFGYIPGGSFTIQTNTGTERMRILSGGNVGIGTSSPGSKLNVSDSGTTYVQVTGNGRNLYLGQDATGGVVYSDGAVPMVFSTNGAEKMRITSAGGVAFGGASNYGSSGQVLKSNGDAPPSWGAVTMPAGSVIQVVNVDNSTLYSFTGSVNVFSASITPSSASNKVLVICSIAFGYSGDAYPYVYMLRNGTSISTGTSASGNQRNVFLAGYGTSTSGTPYRMSIFAKSYLDSPGTTSAVTYQIQAQCEFGTGYINRQSDQSNNVYINYPTSNITLMEIKG